MDALGVADDAQARAAPTAGDAAGKTWTTQEADEIIHEVKVAAVSAPELYTSDMMRTDQEELRIMRRVIEADGRLDALYA